MTSAVVRTGKLLDRELVTILDQLFAWFPAGNAVVTLPLGASVKLDTRDALASVPHTAASRSILALNFTFPDGVQEAVAFHRGITDPDRWKSHPNRAGFQPALPSAAFDELALLEPHSPSQPRKQLNTDAILRIHELLQQHAASVSAASDEEAKRLSKVVSRQTDDLRKLYLEMAEGLSRAQARSQEEFAQRQAELERSFSARVAGLSAQEAELERRRQELNDREPQHERRRLRELLTASLRGSLQQPLAQSRRSEQLAYVLYLATGGVFIGISVALALTDISTDGSAAFWARTAKSLASGLAGAAFAWAGLTGLKTSAVALREHEKAVERYAFDMDRASWIVETILQMNAVEESQVPEQWLEAVCRDLFASSAERGDDRASLEAFAALFDATAKARIGTSGIEFEIDRKGAKKLAQE